MYGAFGSTPPGLDPDVQTDGLLERIAAFRDSVESSGHPDAEWLDAHLRAMDARLRSFEGEPLHPEQEMRLLFDLELPTLSTSAFAAARDSLDRLLPGEGSVQQRFEAWTRRMALSPEQVRAATPLILAETRRRTLEHVELPAVEEVQVVMEEEAPYGAWAEYRGAGTTLLHVNTGRGLHPDWLVHILAHEGYPGHHVQLTLLEQAATAHPALAFLPPMSPTLALLEGGADAASQALWTEDAMEDWILEVLLPALEIDVDAALWRGVRRHVETVLMFRQQTTMLSARGMATDSVATLLQHYGLTSAATARALTDEAPSPFPRAFELINSKHSPAAEHIHRFISAAPDPLRRYAALYREPTLPSQLTGGG